MIDTTTPERRSPWALPAHIAAGLLVQSTSWAQQGTLAVLMIKRFGANEWQSLLITASPTIFFSLSIFWGDYLKRGSYGRTLLAFWLVACAPMALGAFAQNYWSLAILHLVACAGGAAYPPINGEMLQALYPASRRGRMYSIIWGVTAVGTAGLTYSLGHWLERDANAFRTYLPLLAGLQGVGVCVFEVLSRASGHARQRVVLPKEDRGHWAALAEPVLHMGRILKADPVFARYEAAYMTYGVGWMIGAALLPVFVTDRLGLNYEQIPLSTNVPYLGALVLALLPAGLMMDRMGAVRSTALSFCLLTLYPLGLIFVRSEPSLAVVSVVFGLAHAGASVGWTIGPVSLAPTPDKVSAYMAIHATMVGIRGKIFQGLGVLLYSLTKDFTLPFALAALAYAWSGVQMYQLDRRMREAKAKPAGESTA